MDRKVVLYIGMSLDGYIADKKGNVSWLEGQGDDIVTDFGYSKFIKSVDTVIIGMNTYVQIVEELSPNNWPYKNMKSYVFTSKNVENTSEVDFISGDMGAFINELKSQEGKNIWICGGANIANQLIERNLIDEYYLSIMPIILGDGIRLFNEKNSKILLRLNHTEVEDGVMTMIYTVRDK